jgi:hypothetical protein
MPRAEAKMKVFENSRSNLFSMIGKLNVVQFDNQYGEDIDDSSSRSITVITSQTNKTIEILCLHNWQLPKDKNHKRLAEIVPLLKIWGFAYKWFVEPHLINFSDIDNKITEQTEKESGLIESQKQERVRISTFDK